MKIFIFLPVLFFATSAFSQDTGSKYQRLFQFIELDHGVAEVKEG